MLNIAASRLAVLKSMSEVVMLTRLGHSLNLKEDSWGSKVQCKEMF